MVQRLTQNLNIGSRLREYRLNAHLTQSAVSDRLKSQGIPISREIYAQIEIGRHHIPVTVLIALHELYCFSYDDLFDTNE